MTIKNENINKSAVRPLGIYFDGLSPFWGKLLIEHDNICFDDEYQIAQFQRFNKGKYCFTINYSSPEGIWKNVKGMIDYHLEKKNAIIEFSIIVSEYTDKNVTMITEYSNVTSKWASNIINSINVINFGAQIHDENNKPADLIEEN